MADSRVKRISRYQLEQARHRNNSVYGYFNAYCHLNESCDTCNWRIRLLCKLKNKIEDLRMDAYRKQQDIQLGIRDQRTRGVNKANRRRKGGSKYDQ